MKKIIALFSVLMILVSGCTKFNDKHFEGWDDRTDVKNTVAYKYTLTEADYKAMKIAKQCFTPSNPAKEYVPAFLQTLFKAADTRSSVMLTYNFSEDREAFLDSMTRAKTYALVAADYASLLGYESNALNPSAMPNSAIPNLLKTKLTAVNGQYAVVTYNYSEEVIKIEGLYLKENLEAHAAGTGIAVALPGWINYDVDGSNSRVWECRLFSNNKYAQVTSNSGSYTGKNTVYLVSPKLDLRKATDPIFKFSVGVGYWRGAILDVLVSTDYNGTQDGLKTATWIKINDQFSLPTTGNPAGYEPLTPAGEANLSAYKGKQIYVAFRYNGNETGPDTPEQIDPNRKTTTYQIDDIEIVESNFSGDGADVAFKTFISTFLYDGSAWKPAEKTLTVQPADYEQMGLTAISIANAPTYLPTILRLKYPYALEGDLRSVVYKTSETANRADQYCLRSGIWEPNTKIMTRSEQYVRTEGAWIFDPTITYTLTKDDHTTMINYMLASSDPNMVNMVNQQFKNEEFYYGFSSRYNNLSFRISYRTNYLQYDAEMAALSGDNAAMLALMFERAKEGLAIFLQMKYPDAKALFEGTVDQYYQVVVAIHSPNDGVQNETFNYVYKFQCIQDGNESQKPEFKYVEHFRQ